MFIARSFHDIQLIESLCNIQPHSQLHLHGLICGLTTLFGGSQHYLQVSKNTCQVTDHLSKICQSFFSVFPLVEVNYSFDVTHFYLSGKRPRAKYQSLSHLKKNPILMVSSYLYSLPLLSYLFSTSFVFLLFYFFFSISLLFEHLFTLFCISLHYSYSLPVFRTITRRNTEFV